MIDYGRLILTVGGSHSNYDHSDKVEFYDVEKDKWMILPSINERKYSPTIVNINNSVIYSFGGGMYENRFRPGNAPSSTIEFLEFSSIYQAIQK